MMRLSMQITLEQIAVIRAGHPFRGAINESLEGNGYVIQTRDQNDEGDINWEQLVLTDVAGRKEPEWLKPNDIVFAARGARNLASVVPDINKSIVCSPHYFQIRVTECTLIQPEFLAWQLNQSVAQRYFLQSAEGTAQVSIRRSVLDNTSIIIPPLATQQRMVKMAQHAKQEKQIYQRLIELRHLELDAIGQQILKESII
jgi:restriction endonuclease S subunit